MPLMLVKVTGKRAGKKKLWSLTGLMKLQLLLILLAKWREGQRDPREFRFLILFRPLVMRHFLEKASLDQGPYLTPSLL